jgi:hypothetical protein
MVTRKQQLDTDIDFLVSTKVGNLHDIQQGGLREVRSPLLGDYLRILSLSYGQVLMWGECVIDFVIAEVEFAKLQRCNIILVCSNCADPLRRYVVTKAYSKSLGTLSRFTAQLRGGI